MPTTKQQQPGTVPADNLLIYNQLRMVPDEAKKTIIEGRLKGKTDINPMWRIKRLTEIYGPCGFGWKYTIKRTWTETFGDSNAAAYMDVDLFVKDPVTKEWSEAIPGTGGNVLKRMERSGTPFLNDDAYKMCLTDAISVAAKALGLAADVYFEQDTTKYSYPANQSRAGSRQQTAATPTPVQGQAQPQVASAPGTKPVLSPQSPLWNANITKVAGTADSIQNIRARIEKVFTISDNDFNILISAAGRAAS